MSLDDIIKRLIWFCIGFGISYANLQLRVNHVMKPWPAIAVLASIIVILGFASKSRGAGAWLCVGLTIAHLVLEPGNGPELIVGALITLFVGLPLFHLGIALYRRSATRD